MGNLAVPVQPLKWSARLVAWSSLHLESQRWLRRGLQTHISVSLFALPLLGAIWFATFHYIDSERLRARTVGARASEELIDTYEALVMRNLMSIDQTLKVLKYAIELTGAGAALPALKQQDLLPSGLLFTVSITDRAGKIVVSNPPAKPVSVARQRYFMVHRDGAKVGLFISPALNDAASPDGYLHFTRRLNDAGGRFAGIVIVAVKASYFTSAYEPARLGKRGMLGLFGADPVLRVVRIGDQVFGHKSASLLPGSTSRDASAINPWDGVQRFVSVRQLQRFPLKVVLGLAEDEQMAAFEQVRRSHLWQAAIASAVLALLATLASVWSWQANKALRRVRQTRKTYAVASEASLDGFFVLRSVRDQAGVITDFAVTSTNSRAEKMSGMSKQELRGKMLCILLPECRSNGIFTDLLEVAVGGGVHETEWENHMPTLRGAWLHRQVVAVDGGLVVIVRDISERKLAQQRMLHMAHYDALTGLPNRSLISERVKQSIALAQGNGRQVAVAFLDLDGFKVVNDALGHNAGDAMLKIVGQRLLQCVRSGDTVGRFGGDEFVIILPGQEAWAASDTALLDKVLDALARPTLLDGQEVKISCSMGVAHYPRDGFDFDTLLIKAGAAMYRAKEMGRNNCQIYAREMSIKGERKLTLLEGLRKALDDAHFRVVYQPQVDLRSGLIIGVEALIRWQHPQHGSIPPLDFIALAEESGMIVAIGEWVLQTACRQSMEWQAAGLAPIMMSVNVSPRQFDQKRLVECVAQALQDSGLDAGALELEVTESAIMRDMQQSIEKMRELKAMGIVLSIDDFGTGHSSLWALKSFPVSRLKIDKSFVNDLAHSPDDQAIAVAVIALGHKLNLRVIAEGVETEPQRRFLSASGCDEMQGHLFGKPMTPQEIQSLLERQARAAPAKEESCQLRKLGELAL